MHTVISFVQLIRIPQRHLIVLPEEEGGTKQRTLVGQNFNLIRTKAHSSVEFSFLIRTLHTTAV